MLRYNSTREDYINHLVLKYVKMKEAIYIEGESCSKCMMMKPHVQKRCDENGYEFQCIRFDDISVQEFQISSVPMLIIKENGILEGILDEEGIVHLISNQ